jgi:hypothetical protein
LRRYEGKAHRYSPQLSSAAATLPHLYPLASPQKRCLHWVTFLTSIYYQDINMLCLLTLYHLGGRRPSMWENGKLAGKSEADEQRGGGEL